MRTAKRTGIALIAILAFTALSAAAASAHTWEFDKSPITSAKRVKGKATFEIEEPGLGLKARCEMIRTGTVGPGAAGVVESVTNSKSENTITCENLDHETCSGTVTIEALDLSWSTELETVSGELRNVVKEKGFQWVVKCKSSSDSYENHCSGAISTILKNNPAGFVESIFKKSTFGCVAASLLFSGTEDITPINEGSLSAS
jgi:hypothetical protein